MILRSPRFCRKHAPSILACIVLCWTVLSSGCNSHSKKHSDDPNAAEGTQAAVMKNHPNTTKGTQAVVKEIVAVVEKSLAGLPPPPSVPAVCEPEMTKLREALKTASGAGEAADANSALLGCISKATNEAKCKGKPQPCGVVYYNPPIKAPGAGQPALEPSEAKAVDVSAPDQIAAACREIAGAGPASGAILSSLIGNYSCEAWFKAAATNDPTLLIALGFVPTIQLLRDLKTYTNGVPDVTPDAVLANTVKRVDRTLVIMRVGGEFVPVGVLPLVPVGGTSGQVLDGALATAQLRVNQVSRAVEDRCKEAGICR